MHVGVQLSVISDPTKSTFYTCVTTFVFDFTYTAFIHQNVLVVIKKYIYCKIGPKCFVLLGPKCLIPV